MKNTIASLYNVRTCWSQLKSGYAAANEIMRRNYDAPLVDDRGRLFKVHNQSDSLSAAARKSDYKNRFILTGARDLTKTRASS